MEFSLRQKFIDGAKLYKDEAQGPFTNLQVGQIICKEIPYLLAKAIYRDKDMFFIKGSIGKGKYAEIPWIAIFNEKITMSAQKGIYLVYLYSSDMKYLYLSLNQGFSYFKNKFGNKEGQNQVKKVSNYLKERFNLPQENKIDLKSRNDLGKGYMAAHITGKCYHIDNMPDNEELIKDLTCLMNIYKYISLNMLNRDFEDFYHYILSLKENEIEEEIIINSVDVMELVDNYKDEPIRKQRPVINNKGHKVYIRNIKISKLSLKNSDFKCEANKDHYSFKVNKNENMYVEAHHLIPISTSDYFENSLDVPANICSLCPNCHRCIHLGRSEDKKRILEILYHARKKRLQCAGIEVSFDQIKNFYHINDN